MNLVIDIGNNYFKLAVFQKNRILFNTSEKNRIIERNILNVLDQYTEISNCIISNVSSLSVDYILEKRKINFCKLTTSLKLPFKLNYNTPESLGDDRIALVAASLKLYPNSNNIIIDTGTCITIDFIDQNSNYMGGMISPGIEMRYKSLHNYTSRLPDLEKSTNFHFPADSTSGSIHAGVVGGVTNEILGFVNQIISKYKIVNIILTGGDAKFLSKTLKIPIFADQIFILDGLNSILNLNKK